MHLTDEQLNEYLDHETNDRAEIEAHLSSCADCAARLADFQSLFAEIESLPDLKLSHPVAAGPSVRLPCSLSLTATVQAALAVVAIIIAAPLVMESVSPFMASLPALSLTDLVLQLQAWWRLWLDTLSNLQMPSIPEIPVVDASNLVTSFAVIAVSLLWLVGNGLLLRNQIK